MTVLDYTETYVRVGADLTRRTGLDRLVAFRHGDATRMPFEAGSFDAAWTQHSSMIANQVRNLEEGRIAVIQAVLAR